VKKFKEYLAEALPGIHHQDQDIPVVLVLKRQSMRVFPDGTYVVVYYSDKIGKTVTIPFDRKSEVATTVLSVPRSEILSGE